MEERKKLHPIPVHGRLKREESLSRRAGRLTSYQGWGQQLISYIAPRGVERKLARLGQPSQTINESKLK